MLEESNLSFNHCIVLIFWLSSILSHSKFTHSFNLIYLPYRWCWIVAGFPTYPSAS